MTEIGVRNIDGFNSKFKEKMPYIVVIVDEMSDLMLVAGKEIENYIQKLSQMARAAGIHIIMATQRPSVDVITGTIKANFPTRISFQVSSKIDSRTILGEQGAEQLLGKGDMLFMSSANRIIRIHGPYIGENEIEKINTFLRTQAKPSYLDEITNFSKDSDAINKISDNDKDELYEKAIMLIKNEGKASTSFLQRKLQIGYNRAARIIDMMEEDGIVGQPNHVGKREVL
jgi:S-DNA-T family DNA segregation ATPase FtsK/SpoIIIE